MVCWALCWLAGGRLCFGEPAEPETARLLPSAGPFVGHTWRVEDGLPHNTVTAMAQGRDGYLWIGTANGLARFDGVQFTRFGLRDGLSSLFIKALLEDREGGLWIGTVNGLSRYQNGRFTTWTTRDGLAGNVILALDEDAEGAVWIATNTGLSRWHRDAFETMGREAGLSNRYVPTVAAEPSGAVWVAVTGLGLLRWDGTACSATTNFPGAPTAAPARMVRDRSGRIWAGTVGAVYCLEADGWKTFGSDEGLPRVSITSLGEGADGSIWAGTIDEGLFYLRNGKFQRVSQEDGLSDTAIMALAADHENNVWVGTRAGGLNRLKPRQVFVWRHLEDGVEVPPMSLAEAADGTLWVAAQGRGIYRLDTRGEHWSVGEPLAGPLPYGAILSARDGTLWLGAAWRLLQWRNGTLVGSYASAPELRGDSVRCLWEDREEGMWLATRDGRLLLLRDGRFTTFTNGLPRDMMTALVQQRDGTVWIGSYGGGLGRLQNGVGTTFGREQGLASDLIRVLYLDSRERLWIGTEGGGLSCFKDGALRSFGLQHGIGDDTVVQILEDDAGDLWLGTYRGIYRIRRPDMEALLAGHVPRVHPHAFDQSDGLLSAQCIAGFGAALKTREGRLFFSTDRGLVVIDPRRLLENADPPVVRLERLVVNGQPWPTPLQRSQDGPAASVGELRIPPGQQRFEFQYTALLFAAPERVCFRYRLLGLTAEWVEAGAQRAAQFSYLPPGRYRFEVAAHNGNGRWSEPAPALPLVVLPHVWQTWWFYLACWLGGVGAVSGSVVFVIRRRHQARLRELERRRSIESERARIAQDLHDDLGAGLTEIGLTSELVQDASLAPTEIRGYAGEISTRARELVSALDEIVWAVNPRNDSAPAVAAYFSQFTQRMLKPPGIRCRLDIQRDLTSLPLKAHQRHDLFLAFKEAVANVARHSQAREVRLAIQVRDAVLAIELEDDGVGFDPGASAAGADGLNNMRERLRRLDGTCEITSEPGHGTTLRFRLPLASGRGVA